ncbi:MAG: ribonuclease H-like domain-containing protein [bacterium]
MLFHTFLHIPGVGERLERMLWQHDIFTWDDFLESPQSKQLLGRKYRTMVRYIEKSKNNLHNAQFFKKLLPAKELWRLFDHFREKTVYLDIESVYQKSFHEITVIGLYGNGHMKSFVQGINLEDFRETISLYDLIVTYNGICFDLPVLRQQLKMGFPHAHIDLRFFLKRLGFTGGLKGIEKQFGISRSDGIDGLNGYDAVLLWKKYLKGDQQALTTLIEYNTCDTRNLNHLMDEAYKLMFEKMFPANGHAEISAESLSEEISS